MNLQTFFLRAGLASLAAGAVGYAALATLLPGRHPAAPALLVATLPPVMPSSGPSVAPVIAPPPTARPGIAANAPPVARPETTPRPVALTRSPPPAALPTPPLLVPAPLPPSHLARHLSEPHATEPRLPETRAARHAFDVNAASRPAERPRPAPRSVRADAEPPAPPAYQVYYPVPTYSYAGRTWTYRRVY